MAGPSEGGTADGGSDLRFHKQLWVIKDTLIIVLTPIILLPILFVYPETGGSNPGGCAYTILIMIVYWMTEVIPMAVTAMIPIVLFPWLGVQSSKTICTNYLKDANMLFFGGLLVAIAVEKWNLHKRVALKVLLLVGSKPLWIMFGFMMVTCFLSMWLNNTATTAMMMPIAHAVLEELDASRKAEFDKILADEGVPLTKGTQPDDVKYKNGSENSVNRKHSTEVELSPANGSVSAARTESDKKFMAFRKALKLAVPFSSSIGGCGTLIGCGPNIVMKGQLDSIYEADTGINFTTWLVVGFPTMIIDIFAAWIILMLIFFGVKDTFYCIGRKDKEESGEVANDVIKAEYAKLGSFSFAEAVVLVNFIVLAGLWFMREPDFIPGWGSLMSHKFVTDASLAITISVLLFIFPSRPPNYLCFRRCSPEKTKPPKPAPPILDWGTVNKQMPWSVILLLGGGFALADGCKESGLSKDIGTQLRGFDVLDPWLIAALCALMAMFVTSFTSNMATATIFIPIMAELSAETHVNPIYLILPVTLASSYAYLLPVATPPNAIAYSYGDLVITDMMKAGVAMCALCFVVLQFAINTWGYAFFRFDVYPTWAPDRRNISEILLGNSTLLNSTLLNFTLPYTTDTPYP